MVNGCMLIPGYVKFCSIPSKNSSITPIWISPLQKIVTGTVSSSNVSWQWKSPMLPFYWVETTTTRYIQGTGLGLPIVKEIMEMHQGNV